MNIRNAIYNENGTIDCEIDHPVHGWIPFTASPDDSEEHGRLIYSELVAASAVSDYIPPSAEELSLQADQELLADKQTQKESLMKLKLESMLTIEFAEIDAATTKDDVKLVKLK